MAPTLPSFNPARLRSYIFRLPLFTRVALLVIAVFWIVQLQSAWDVVQWGGLVPKEVGLSSMYRLNTYPLIHVGFLHALFNVFAFAPLMERFEAENGTLVSLAMFAGPLSTIPGGLYVLLERGVLRGNTAVQGASIWVFVLLGIEAMKAYRANPYLMISTVQIPTWTTPLFLLVFVAALFSNTSFLGHLCAVGIGYLYGLGYMKWLAPPERALRYIEGKLNLLGRLPYYVSVDQKTFGRSGVLPTSAPPSAGIGDGAVPMSFLGSSQRLGP